MVVYDDRTRPSPAGRRPVSGGVPRGLVVRRGREQDLDLERPHGGVDAERASDEFRIRGRELPTPTLCVATNYDGYVATSANPGGSGAWSSARIDTTGALDALFCSPGPICFTIDSSGTVFSSGNPTGGASTWTQRPQVPAFTSGSCPTATLCVSVDGSADQISSTADPSGAGAWTRTPTTLDLTSVSCPSTTLCVAVGASGALAVSTDPTAGTWTDSTIDAGRQLTSIACASTTLCVAGDKNGHVVVSTDPTGGPSSWVPALVDGDPCADTTPCSFEQVEASDAAGLHTVDTSKLPGSGPFLTGLKLIRDVLSWSHDGSPRSATLRAG